MKRSGRQKNQNGTSTLELLVVLPTLLLIFFGIIEFSRALLAVNIVTTATREGARVGVVTPTLGGNVFDPTPAVGRIDQILQSANFTTGVIRSVTCPTPCVSNSQVQASVQVGFWTPVPLLSTWLGTPGSPIVINRTTVMRYE
jgi:Flp pilus assembly protein TadG